MNIRNILLEQLFINCKIYGNVSYNFFIQYKWKIDIEVNLTFGSFC